jgi:hypothetical protein
MKYLYKRNGAGDIFRKRGKKVECFYRGKWVKSIFKDTWELSVLKPISENEALTFFNQSVTLSPR